MPPFGFGVSVRATRIGVRWRRRVADGGDGSEGVALAGPDRRSPEPSCDRPRWALRARSAASLMVARGMLRGRRGCGEPDQGPRGRWLAGPAYAACGHRVGLARGRSAPDVWPTVRNHAPAQVGGPVGGGG